MKRPIKYPPSGSNTRRRREILAYLIAEQDGLCAICKHPYINGIDHDHETGMVRAALCLTCNIGLGMFKDSPTLLKRAVIYLKQHKDGY